ncbi:MAG: formylmethanofuran dehydrogenase subunit E family protein [Dehalococcoidia bacterium]|jgi:formylmethanofuran dehydrogenase subunit E
MRNVTTAGITVCGHTYDRYLGMIKDFHGHVAPGVVLGGLMVDIACRNLPKGQYFDALSETRSCLPDAIQLLTPCTVGNGWLRIVDLSKFALSLFEKYTGNGVRVFVDSQKLERWPELKTFFFKLIPKKEQDSKALMVEIRLAGTSIFAVEKVVVDLDSIRSSKRRAFAICPGCGEGYPKDDGDICISCQGRSPYLSCVRRPDQPEGDANASDVKRI